jgi:pimeloyl-ACP methyl ester carboxylesterase
VLGWGGGSKTWFERMLAFDRNALELGDTAAADIATRMREHEAFHAQYLLEGMDPPAIIAADPSMARVWSDIIGTSADAHYGRAFAFHQQAQRADWTAAWGRIDVPVLLVMGEYDWFENRAGHETVVRIVNRQRPGLARFEVIPRTDHHFVAFPDARAAFREEGGWDDARPFLDLALGWLEKL